MSDIGKAFDDAIQAAPAPDAPPLTMRDFRRIRGQMALMDALRGRVMRGQTVAEMRFAAELRAMRADH